MAAAIMIEIYFSSVNTGGDDVDANDNDNDYDDDDDDESDDDDNKITHR